MVGPGGIAHRRRYSSAAIALALSLWCISGLPQAAVRTLVSPWRMPGSSEVGRWRSLRRWVRDGLAGRLLRDLPPVAPLSTRAAGEAVVQQLVARHLPAQLGPLCAEVGFAAGAHAR